MTTITKRKTWQDKQVDAFKSELEELMRKYDVTISHQDKQGAFIMDLDPEHMRWNIDWMWEARWED